MRELESECLARGKVLGALTLRYLWLFAHAGRITHHLPLQDAPAAFKKFRHKGRWLYQGCGEAQLVAAEPALADCYAAPSV